MKDPLLAHSTLGMSHCLLEMKCACGYNSRPNSQMFQAKPSLPANLSGLKIGPHPKKHLGSCGNSGKRGARRRAAATSTVPTASPFCEGSS